MYPYPYSDMPSPIPSMPTSPSFPSSFCESIPMVIPLSPFGIPPMSTYHFPAMQGFQKPYTHTHAHAHARVYNRRPQTRKSAQPQSQPLERDHDQKNLLIHTLPPTTTTQSLRTHLSAAGRLASCTLSTDNRTGQCTGFARAVYQHADDARRAVGMFQDGVFGGVRIRIRVEGGETGGGMGMGVTSAVETKANTTATGTATGTGRDAGEEEEVKCRQQQREQQSPLVVNGSGIAASA